MSTKRKKSSVNPGKASEWLRCYEEEGMSPPKIAEKDGYDVRTVRKMIDRARRERHERDVKSAVYERALEKHYADMCTFAKKLLAFLSANSQVEALQSYRNDPLWKALKEHMPKSKLWSNINKWETTLREFNKSADSLDKQIQKKTVKKTQLRFIEADTLDIGLLQGLVDAVKFHLTSVARSGLGLKGARFTTENVETFFLVKWGPYSVACIGHGDVENVEEIKKLCLSLIKNANAWKGYTVLVEKTGELKEVNGHLEDELTRIRMKRVVEGKCRYCPF
jgi:hypothetical protein